MRGISGVSCSPNQIRQSDSDIESWSRQRRGNWLVADLKMRKPRTATNDLWVNVKNWKML